MLMRYIIFVSKLVESDISLNESGCHRRIQVGRRSPLRYSWYFRCFSCKCKFPPQIVIKATLSFSRSRLGEEQHNERRA